MKFALCSSSLELSNLCFEGLRCNTADLRFAKSFQGFGFLAKNENVQQSYRNGKRMVISSQLMPGHLEGSFMGNKQLQDPSRKLDFVRTLLIDNYDSYTYNIYQELSVVNGGNFTFSFAFFFFFFNLFLLLSCYSFVIIMIFSLF